MIILGSLIFTLNTQGQDFIKEEKATIETPASKASFDKTNHNFGELVQGNPATATFKMKNDGTEPLMITAVSTSCGCTAPVFPKEPLKPGKSGEIKLTYDAKTPGFFKKSAQVKTQDGKIHTLYIEGEVKKAVPEKSEK